MSDDDSTWFSGSTGPSQMLVWPSQILMWPSQIAVRGRNSTWFSGSTGPDEELPPSPPAPRNTLPAETPPAPLVLVTAAVCRWVGLMLLLDKGSGKGRVEGRNRLRVVEVKIVRLDGDRCVDG